MSVASEFWRIIHGAEFLNVASANGVSAEIGASPGGRQEGSRQPRTERDKQDENHGPSQGFEPPPCPVVGDGQPDSRCAGNKKQAKVDEHYSPGASDRAEGLARPPMSLRRLFAGHGLMFAVGAPSNTGTPLIKQASQASSRLVAVLSGPGEIRPGRRVHVGRVS